MLANHVFWRLMHFYTPLLLLLQPSVLWLSIVTFNNDAKPPPKWILREFDVSRIRPRPGGLPHLETFTWQNLTPAERVTRSGRPGYPLLGGHPTYHVNVIKLKREIKRTVTHFCACAATWFLFWQTVFQDWRFGGEILFHRPWDARESHNISTQELFGPFGKF